MRFGCEQGGDEQREKKSLAQRIAENAEEDKKDRKPN
jgi:hypothetical protein